MWVLSQQMILLDLSLLIVLVTDPVVLRVQSINNTASEMTLAGIQTVSNVFEGAPPQNVQQITDLEVVSGDLINVEDNTFFTTLGAENVDSVDLGTANLVIKRVFTNVLLLQALYIRNCS